MTSNSKVITDQEVQRIIHSAFERNGFNPTLYRGTTVAGNPIITHDTHEGNFTAAISTWNGLYGGVIVEVFNQYSRDPVVLEGQSVNLYLPEVKVRFNQLFLSETLPDHAMDVYTRAVKAGQEILKELSEYEYIKLQTLLTCESL